MGKFWVPMCSGVAGQNGAAINEGAGNKNQFVLVWDEWTK